GGGAVETAKDGAISVRKHATRCVVGVRKYAGGGASNTVENNAVGMRKYVGCDASNMIKDNTVGLRKHTGCGASDRTKNSMVGKRKLASETVEEGAFGVRKGAGENGNCSTKKHTAIVEWRRQEHKVEERDLTVSCYVRGSGGGTAKAAEGRTIGARKHTTSNSSDGASNPVKNNAVGMRKYVGDGASNTIENSVVGMKKHERIGASNTVKNNAVGARKNNGARQERGKLMLYVA
ncbi:hypothetical protein Pfo_025821, partial [Paulownia fortunei]